MTEDLELLSRYATERSEAAFSEFTQRNVDLVYSAALRLVNGDVPSAEDVAQQVFTEAARQAKTLSRHSALVGWLYTTTRNVALRMNRTEQRRKAREQEANTMNELLHDDSPAADWTQLGPVLEEVMHELDERDRHAVLLRFFRNKPLKEVGAALNLNENAARMRVERALDKMRGKLAGRGISTTAGVLAAAMAANAVQAAPAGLASTISASAVIGAALQVSTAITATKAITMTALQKSIVAAALTVAVGTGVYAVHQGSQMRKQIQALEQQRAPLAEQIQQLEQERNEVTNQLAALKEENARLKSGQNTTELMKLRGEVGMLRQKPATALTSANVPSSGIAKMMSDPAMKEYIRIAQREKIRSMFADFFKELKLSPDQAENCLQVLCDHASKSLDRLTSTGQVTPDASTPGDETALNNQLQSVLGDAGYARFKEYSQEIPARTTVSLLNTQLGDNPINDEQSARLLQIIKAEPYNLTQGVTGAPDKAFLGSQSDIDSFLQQVRNSNQRIVQQAGGVLAPDQLAALDTVLNNAIDSRKLQAAALIQKH
jgi:RNA polymerase sigma factor (sigma-70 family)